MPFFHYLRFFTMSIAFTIAISDVRPMSMRSREIFHGHKPIYFWAIMGIQYRMNEKMTKLHPITGICCVYYSVWTES
jgi:hypothetical protein